MKINSNFFPMYRVCISRFRMALWFSVFIIGLSLTGFTESAFAQDQKPSAAEFIPYKALPKKERKQRLKEPAYVQIAAPQDRVRALITQIAMSNNYFVQNSSLNSLAFTKRIGGVGGVLMGALVGGTDAEMSLNFSIAEIDGVSHVNAQISMSTQNRFGARSFTDGTSIAKQREGLDDVLKWVKTEAEK